MQRVRATEKISSKPIVKLRVLSTATQLRVTWSALTLSATTTKCLTTMLILSQCSQTTASVRMLRLLPWAEIQIRTPSSSGLKTINRTTSKPKSNKQAMQTAQLARATTCNTPEHIKISSKWFFHWLSLCFTELGLAKLWLASFSYFGFESWWSLPHDTSDLMLKWAV